MIARVVINGIQHLGRDVVSNTISCRICSGMVSPNAEKCPKCDDPDPSGKRTRNKKVARLFGLAGPNEPRGLAASPHQPRRSVLAGIQNPCGQSFPRHRPGQDQPTDT